MTDEEIEYFRTHIKRLLHQMFLDKKISSAGAYFAIWHQVRKVLEEELSFVVNAGVHAEIEKIKAD